MSVISLTIAPLIAGNDDWQDWYFGIIPVVVGVIISYYCYVVYWSKDITYKNYDEVKTDEEAKVGDIALTETAKA